MKKARISVPAEITIEESEFPKVKDWDYERLKTLVQEIRSFEGRVRSVSGLKLKISLPLPSNFEILNAIRAVRAQN